MGEMTLHPFSDLQIPKNAYSSISDLFFICFYNEWQRIGVFNRSYYEEVLVVRAHPELLQYQQLPHIPKPILANIHNPGDDTRQACKRILQHSLTKTSNFAAKSIHKLTNLFFWK